MILKVSRFIAPSLSSLPLETFCHIAVSDFQKRSCQVSDFIIHQSYNYIPFLSIQYNSKPTRLIDKATQMLGYNAIYDGIKT